MPDNWLINWLPVSPGARQSANGTMSRMLLACYNTKMRISTK